MISISSKKVRRCAAALGLGFLACGAAAPSASLTSLKEVLGARASLPRGAGRAKVSSACLALWEKLSAVDLGELLGSEKLHALPDPGKCSQLPEELGPLAASYSSACHDYFKPIPAFASKRERWSPGLSQCMPTLYIYRGGVTAWLTQGQPASQLTSLRTLAAAMQDPDPSHVKLYESAAKMYAIARRNNPDDPQVIEGGLIAETRGFKNAELLKSEAEKMSQEMPHSGLGYYYQAFARWKARDDAGALELVKKAVQLEPKNTRYADALVALQKNPPDASAQPFRADFGVDVRSWFGL